MRTTIDAAGRLVVPKPLRREIGLPSGGPVDIEVIDGELRVRPTGFAKLARDEEFGLLVLTADVPTEELPTYEDLRAILDAVRERRLL